MSTARLGTAALLGAVLVAAAALLGAAAGSAATPGAPSAKVDPSIAGSALVGQTLTGDKGIWEGTAVIAYTYTWLRCNADGEKCNPIGNATSVTYLLVSSDIGYALRFRVTATNKQGSKYETSSPTGVVVEAGGKPASKTAPEITGSAYVGSALTSTTGTWVGDQPITYHYAWQRCDKEGNACKSVSNGGKARYTLVSGDAGHSMRIRVTAENSRGKSSAISAETAVVQDVGGGNGVIVLPGGGKSVPVSDVPKGERLIVDQVQFTPNPVSSRDNPIQARVLVKDTRGNYVRDAYVFVRSTPILTSTPTDTVTGVDGWITYLVTPRADFPLKNGYSVQFFVKAYRKGDDPLAGVSGTRLVQVATSSG